MKTAGRETPNSRARLCHEPSTWGGRPKPFLLNHTGWRSRKRPVEVRVFFLTSPFIELLGTWPNSDARLQARDAGTPQENSDSPTSKCRPRITSGLPTIRKVT